MNPYRSGRLASVSDRPEIVYFVKLISNIFRLVDKRIQSQTWNDPICLVCQCIMLSEFTQSRSLRKQNKTRVDTRMSERKWQQPRLQFVTKFHGRRELGLPTSSAAVHPQKMMLCTMFRAMQTTDLLNVSIFWCVCTSRPFYYFHLLTSYL